jgi:hypothetical protein
MEQKIKIIAETKIDGDLLFDGKVVFENVELLINS